MMLLVLLCLTIGSMLCAPRLSPEFGKIISILMVAYHWEMVTYLDPSSSMSSIDHPQKDRKVESDS
jgi:hypothetical protein